MIARTALGPSLSFIPTTCVPAIQMWEDGILGKLGASPGSRSDDYLFTSCAPDIEEHWKIPRLHSFDISGHTPETVQVTQTDMRDVGVE